MRIPSAFIVGCLMLALPARGAVRSLSAECSAAFGRVTRGPSIGTVISLEGPEVAWFLETAVTASRPPSFGPARIAGLWAAYAAVFVIGEWALGVGSEEGRLALPRAQPFLAATTATGSMWLVSKNDRDVQTERFEADDRLIRNMMHALHGLTPGSRIDGTLHFAPRDRANLSRVVGRSASLRRRPTTLRLSLTIDAAQVPRLRVERIDFPSPDSV